MEDIETKVEQVEEVTPVVETTTEEPANKADGPDSYSLIRDMMKEMKEYQKMMEDETRNILHRNYHLSDEVMVPLAFISKSKIDEMTLEEINEFFDKHVYENYTSMEYDDVEEARLAMNEIKKLQYIAMKIRIIQVV